MNKKFVVFATALAFVFSLAIAGGVAKANDKGPAEMVLKTAAAKKPAHFNHAKHQETFKCEECHHTKTADGKQGPYAEGAQQKCETCHNAEMMTDVKLADFKGAAHGLCKECHKKHKDTAPSKCEGCHPKK